MARKWRNNAVTIPSKSSQSTKKDPSAPATQTIIKSWGKIDRSRGVQAICKRITNDESDQDLNKQIVIARQNGEINIVYPSQQELKSVYEFREDSMLNAAAQEKASTEKKSIIDKRSSKFVGLFANESTLVTCTDFGVLRYYSLASSTEEKTSSNTTITLSSDLCCLRVHPKQNHIIAFGGKERDLTAWDINEYKAGKSPINERSNSYNKKYQKKKEEAPGVLWRAKNLPNDFLDMRVPVWITDLQFMDNDDVSRIVVGTYYHQIRLYDIKTARRPVLNVEIGEHPIVSICVGRNPYEIFASDTACNVYSMDVRAGSLLGQFKGFTGSVRDLAIHAKSESLVTVGLDRFLRVHEIKGTRNLLHKVYLKQRLSCLLVDDNVDEYDKVNDEKQESDQDEDVWQRMAEIKEPKTKKRKIRQNDDID
ncbi:3741_t:CDS:10 [Ambispora leptoticha]|uniref:Ribosome biogenesis protein NSA1 n=1 Tax=Ambispora leptoticha TaxID=144679 RepID=A0A9N8VC76_9GLOM|nr:3741_t:CDS:10 [Ambispora leptoticha]